jgi:hypothetical protein
MNDIMAAHRDREVHVILDDLNTHKPKQDRWLARHPNVHFHFIPTYSSWLNMADVWLSILSRQALRNRTIRQLREAIDPFCEGIPTDGRSVRVDQGRRTSLPPATLLSFMPVSIGLTASRYRSAQALRSRVATSV